MKFTNQDLANLNNILSICSLVGIDAFVIEDGRLSSVNADRTCAFLTGDNIPVLPENVKLSLSKLKMLKDRLDIFKGEQALIVETVDKNNGEVSRLNISGTKAKIQHATAVRSTVKAPKAINDTPVKTVIITKDEATTILNAIKGMGAKKVAFIMKKGKQVKIELTDSNNDKFEVELENAAKPIGTDRDLVSYYFSDVFSAILKAVLAETDQLITFTAFEASAIFPVNSYPLTLLCPMDNQ
jgi:hypothetical protein